MLHHFDLRRGGKKKFKEFNKFEKFKESDKRPKRFESTENKKPDRSGYRRCWNCDKKGHFAADCRVNKGNCYEAEVFYSEVKIGSGKVRATFVMEALHHAVLIGMNVLKDAIVNLRDYHHLIEFFTSFFTRCVSAVVASFLYPFWFINWI
eukprot:TRINITY_DN6413_c0_g1_i2.p1 TRINITY_DN6413_c0_g1~~TRINITY_DN6413_c0_g1_i2.p1  ORF type:complete len:150 (-),score=6.75 TRINITY_DN6413_c0_g1_i2:548-997(-)